MPAILKGFIERVLQPDLLAIQAAGDKANWKIFKGKSARIIMTMGMPGWFYRWYYGAHALKLLRRNMLHLIGVSPVRSTVYGMIEAVGDQTRKQWLREVEALGHQAQAHIVSAADPHIPGAGRCSRRRTGRAASPSGLARARGRAGRAPAPSRCRGR